MDEFGLKEGINEVICVTEHSGKINTAPIGLIVDSKVYVRLFGETHTLKNLMHGSKLYANVCYDPLVFAVSAFEDLDESWFAEKYVLKCAYSICVFEPERFEDMKNYKLCTLKFLKGKIVNPSAVRAFNRGFSAVIEATIIATRVKMMDEDISKKIKELGEIVKKCGGKREKTAFSYILSVLRESSINVEFQF